MIKADYKKMEQVIYNLVNNAINYTGEDNTVIINVKVDEVIRFANANSIIQPYFPYP